MTAGMVMRWTGEKLVFGSIQGKLFLFSKASKMAVVVGRLSYMFGRHLVVIYRPSLRMDGDTAPLLHASCFRRDYKSHLTAAESEFGPQ
jgi:hypothetical protein